MSEWCLLPINSYILRPTSTYDKYSELASFQECAGTQIIHIKCIKTLFDEFFSNRQFEVTLLQPCYKSRQEAEISNAIC